MKVQQAEITERDLNHCIDMGVKFLHEHQFPNGEFCCYYSPDDTMEEWCVPDSSVFPTSLIAACLLPLKHLDKVKNIHLSVVSFLSYQMMRGGVWNHFTKWHPWFRYCPADIDNTVFACYVFKSLNVDVPHNQHVLLYNRNAKGLFYTWFVFRPGKLKLNKAYLKVVLREFKYPIKSLLFWVRHEAGRNDVDGVVNANVLFYLGLNKDTQPIVDYLIAIINENKEEDCDKWYRNRFMFYYFLSRNYGHVKELKAVKNMVIDRIYQGLNNDHSFGASAFETAFAISALLNFNYDISKIGNAVSYLLKSQGENGYWKRHVLFYSGPSQAIGWGSEEIVTGFCLEALANYSKAIRNQ